MDECLYDKGIAFIFEGETEKIFYFSLLQYFCNKYGVHLNKIDTDLGAGIYYELIGSRRKIVVKYNCVGTVTQITHSANWFNNSCVKQFPKKMSWTVFLCYDTDSHEADISKFYQDDWKIFRENLTKKKTITVVDMAAKADIEDVLLTDIEGVCSFLGMVPALTVDQIPSGGKGKTKMKKMFRMVGATYHEGGKAQALIDSLNKETIIKSGILPLEEIERICFQ